VSALRRIAHLDMDAYYASVELLRHPELRGAPLVIGGGRGLARLADYSGRGVITTATYEARAFGLRSGMSLARAAALCPQAVLLPADFDEYRRVSRLFKAAVARVAPLIEDRGIDEIFIDLSTHGGDVLAAARAIKAAVREATGLSCSIGVAPNKLLAKIASELDKPDGLTLLEAGDLAARIWPLPATRVNGIGPKAGEKLAALGIRTIGELAAADPAWLMERFGRNYGAWLHDAAHGRDERPIVTEREPKSISRETTFERDLHAVRRGPAAQGLPRAQRRHQAALRQLPHPDPGPHARGAHRRRARDPARRRRMPQTRAARAQAAPARGARRFPRRRGRGGRPVRLNCSASWQ